MNLHQLPLFQGIEHRDMQNIVAHTRFDFHKAEAGQTIVSEGDPMHHLLFVLGGTIHATRQSDSRRYSITETLNAPLLIHPEHLFGLHPAYPRTIVAATDLHLVAVGKEDVLRLAKENLVFQLNLNNILATLAQKAVHRSWRATPLTLRQRIVRFFESHCSHPAGPKTINITMQELAAEIHENRNHVSKTLLDMQSEGLLHVSRGIIAIPALEKLLTPTT